MPGQYPALPVGKQIAGQTVSEPRQGWWDSNKGLASNIGGVIWNALDIQRNIVHNVIRDIGDEQEFDLMRDISDAVTFRRETRGVDLAKDIERGLGISPPKWVTGIHGVALDIGLDPLTYESFGFGPVVKAVTVGGRALRLSKPGMAFFRQATVKALPAVRQAAGASAKAEDILKAAHAAAEAETVSAIEKGAKNFIDFGGVKIGIPFTDIQRSVIKSGPVAEAANVAGNVVDKAFAGLTAPLRAGARAVSETETWKQLRKGLARTTGLFDADIAFQRGRGLEGFHIKQFEEALKTLEDDLGKLKATQKERDILTAFAEHPRAWDELAATAGIAPERAALLKPLSERFGKWWKDYGDALRAEGVDVPILGSGVTRRIEQLTKQIADGEERALKTRGRELNKLTRDMARKERELRSLVAARDALRSRYGAPGGAFVEKVGHGATQGPFAARRAARASVEAVQTEVPKVSETPTATGKGGAEATAEVARPAEQAVPPGAGAIPSEPVPGTVLKQEGLIGAKVVDRTKIPVNASTAAELARAEDLAYRTGALAGAREALGGVSKRTAAEEIARAEDLAYKIGEARGLTHGEVKTLVNDANYHIGRLEKELQGLQREKGVIEVRDFTDQELRKARSELVAVMKAAEKMPEYVPHVAGPTFRQYLRERGSKGFHAFSKAVSDHDPHAAARVIIDKWGVPFTVDDVNRMIAEPNYLESIKDKVDKDIYDKVAFIRNDFPEWASEQAAKPGFENWMKKLQGKTPNWIGRFIFAAPAADLAKVFDTDPVRIMASRAHQIARAMGGAQTYREIAALGPEIVRPMGGVAEKGWKSADEIMDAVEAQASASGRRLEPGWREMSTIKALKGLQFHPDVADELTRVVGPITNDEAAQLALKTYDQLASVWRRWVLVAPAYIIRNIIGNAANSAYAGVGPVSMQKAMRALHMGKDVKVAGVTFTPDELIRMAEHHDVLGHGFSAEVRDIADAVKKSPAAKVLNALPNWTFKLNRYAEDTQRMAHFIAMLDRGLTPGEAALSVNKFLFDYSRLTRFEKAIPRRVFMFWTWMRNNAQLQLGMLMHEPWKPLVPFRAAQNFGEAYEPPADFNKIQPEYTKRMLGTFFGRDTKTGDLRVLLQFGLPMEDLYRMDPGEMANQLNPLLKIPMEVSSGQRIGMMSGARVEEYNKAYSFIKHAPDSIKDYLNFEEFTYPNGAKGYRMDPWKLYFLMNTPFSRLYSQVGKLADEQLPGGEKALGFLTGVRIARFNEDSARVRAAKKELRTALEDQMATGHIGRFERFYVRDKEQASEAEKQLVAAQNQFQKKAKKPSPGPVRRRSPRPRKTEQPPASQA